MKVIFSLPYNKRESSDSLFILVVFFDLVKNCSIIGSMRVRTKDCFKCKDQKEVLYRCRYAELTDWVFLCGRCQQEMKNLFEDTYHYGGTWKSK